MLCPLTLQQICLQKMSQVWSSVGLKRSVVNIRWIFLRNTWSFHKDSKKSQLLQAFFLKIQQMQTTSSVPTRTGWENKAAYYQGGGDSAEGSGGVIRLSPEATSRIEHPALSEDVCRQPHLQISPQIDQCPALNVLLWQTHLFTLKWNLLAENKQEARRECHTNAATGGRLLHRKLFKGQQRPVVTPLDREIDSLVSAAWHLHHVLSKWPWTQRWGT